MPKSSNDTLSPEIIKILKIFGLSSVLLVFLLSFFNERRADNTGEGTTVMRMTDPDLLYFKNVRAAYYDREGREDAKMTIYRFGKRVMESETPLLNLSILVNTLKDEAYIYLEPSPEEFPIKIRWKSKEGSQSGELNFDNGDKFAHFAFVKEFYPLILEGHDFEWWLGTEWKPFLQDEKERDAIRITCVDYFKLTNNPK